MYGRFKVKLTSEEKCDEFIVRKFQIGEDTPYLIPVGVTSFILCIEHYAWLIQGTPDGVVITQFHHTQWQTPTTVPTTASVLKLIDSLIKTQMGTGNHAITVLCRYITIKA